MCVVACKTFWRVTMTLKVSFSGHNGFQWGLIWCVGFHEIQSDRDFFLYLKGSGDSLFLGVSHISALNMEVVRQLDWTIVIGPFQLNHSF